MDKWEPHLHWSFRDEHVLLESIHLSSFSGFLVASLVVALVCLTERFVSYLFDNQWGPRIFKRSCWRNALWRSGLYWVATFLRLCYMLAAMSCHLGLLFVMVTALALAQLVKELRSTPQIHNDNNDSSREPLLQESPYSMTPVKTRPRSKSKPDDIFIHPAQSNIARADAAALELGLGGNTERVRGNCYPQDEAIWEPGKGRDIAREMLGFTETKLKGNSFSVGDDSDSPSSSSEF